MSISLEIVKSLRARGASVQMQEDLASFLPNGYDSPLFLPTMDFILLLQNRAQSQQQEQEQSVDLANFNIPKVYDAAYFDKISLKAAGEMIKGANLTEHAQQEILAYLDNMEIQRAKHLGLIGEQGQEIAEQRSVQRRRAQISQSKKIDRGTGKIKSVFESIVTGLNALQASISNANNAQIKAVQQEQWAQQVQQQQSRWRDLLQKTNLQNIFKRPDKKGSENSITKSDNSFLKAMRKVLRPKKNDDANNGDTQLGRVSAKDIFQKRESKGTPTIKPEHADEQKAQIDTGIVQVIAAKAIDATKKDAQLEKKPEIEKPKDSNRTRNTDLQARMQRSRQRMQQQRNEIQQKAEAAQRIDDMTAEKAVKQLKNMGVSMGDSDQHKIGNKDLANLTKPQDKQRGS